MIFFPNSDIPGPSGSFLHIEELLGLGAFGFVFKARDVSSGTLYAVKFPQAAILGGESQKLAIFNEIQAAEKIQHPHIVKVLHTETNPPNNLPPYLVMEFIEGGTLKSYLDRLRSSNTMLDLAILQVWANELVEGIMAINAQMLHRDLKPDNILLDNNHLKIGDFGLSKVVDAATRSRTFKGGQHPFYMAPEGWRYETNAIQLDMYAIGIILYEMASLHYPYEGIDKYSTGQEIEQAHLFQQPRPLRELRPDLPLGFCHIVVRLLEKRPQDRFPDWSTVMQALQTVWNSQSQDHEGPHASIAALLEETGRRYEEETQRRIAQEQRQAEREHRQRLDEFQEQKLLDLFLDEVAAFNEQNHLNAKIGRERIAPAKQTAWILPFGGRIDLHFFWVDPPLELKEGQVRFAALLEDGVKRGVNFLLCRTGPEDLYGTWKVCRVTSNPAVVKPENRRLEPFGFGDAKEIREIEKAEQKITRYTTSFSNTTQGIILDMAASAMRWASEAGG